MAEKTPKLEVRALEKIYGNKCALNKVSFDVKEGETILYLSGCGKTTIPHLIGSLGANIRYRC